MGRGRWRSASGSPSARVTSRRHCPASATSSSTCCSRAPRHARRPTSRAPSTGSAATSTRSRPRSTRRTTAACRVAMPPTGVELLGDVLTRSLFTDEDVESERQVILEELAMDDDSPDDVALRTLAHQLFGDHGLGRDTAGERETVASIAAATSASSSPTTTAPATTTIAVAGDVDHDEVVAEVAAAFADLPAGDGRIARAAPGPARADVEIDDDSEQVHLAIGGRSVPARRPRPRGARRRQPRVRRRAVEPPVRRDPRAPRPRLQRVLGDVGLRRRRRLVGVRRRDARPRRRGRAARRRRARPARRRRHHRRRAGDRHRLPHRRLRARASRTPAPACRASAGCWRRSGG